MLSSNIREYALRILVGIIALALLLLPGGAGAVPVEEWNITFGGAGDDIAHSVQQTSDGGYILTGFTESYGAGKKDVWLIKTDKNGSEQWNKSFGGTGDDRASSIQQTTDGGYVLTGDTFSDETKSLDAWLIKIGIEPAAKAQTASPIEILTAAPTQTPTAAITEPQTSSPKEKIAGFEIILAISTLSAMVYIFRRKIK